MTVHEILLECLENLDSDELKIFKWHLTQGVNEFAQIPKCQLENEPRCAIVECMIKRFQTDGAGELTLLVLKKMNLKNPAKELWEKLGKNEDSLQSKNTAETGAAQKQEGCKPGAEFVEKHRTDLINLVSLVDPIADDKKPLIGTRPVQMRPLLRPEAKNKPAKKAAPKAKKPAAAKKPKSAAAKKPAAKKSPKKPTAAKKATKPAAAKKATKPATAKKATKTPKKAKKTAAPKKAAKRPKKTKTAKPKTAKPKAAKPKKTAFKKK